MEIGAISAIEAIAADAKPNNLASLGDKSDFQVWLESNLDALNNKLVDADNHIKDFAMGKSNNIHEMMLSIESAKLEFQMAVEIRNKVLEAYQELSRMQI